MGEAVIYKVRDHIAYVTLNRPDRKNAINRAMRKEVQDAFVDVRNNPDIWVAILTGNGDTFCAGKDLFEKIPPEMEKGDVMSNDELYLYQRNTFKPFVVALNGPCLAQGGGFALNADIVVMSERASIGWPQVKRGISSVSGPIESPSPKISVVTPSRISPCDRPSTIRDSTDQESMLMNPGATASPFASRTRVAEAFDRSPMAAIRSPRMPTSARRGGPPVPSYTVPPRRMTS